ncbi:MAG: phospholipid/cholesterol/gamma-HCH transport system ATP-binding protein [Myxococcota bacterium]|jgi:phospholipid/cholesterol/gamma-HCH transport system ATP-binding protein
MQDDVVIRMRGVHKAFGEVAVLQGVDLDVQRSENLVVLGRSGSGKSVLIKLLVGLLLPDSGEIEVLGERVDGISKTKLNALRLRVGFCFQHSALYDSMSVGENLAFPLKMNNPRMPASEIDDRITAALEAVSLASARRQAPSALSGGQRKRIGIARTLILEPEIMLYDEPTAGLDPITAKEINDLIVQVRQDYKTTAIVITHDLTAAQAVADRVAMLFDGKVYRVGSFDEVFADDDPRIRAFYRYNFTESSP